MKTNTFYNPKNQYNELLASIPYVDTIKGNIDDKIDNLNTIKVKWVNSGRGDNKFTDIKEYFVSLIDPDSPYYIDKETLKIELGQTIYIIDKTVGTTISWQEWICKAPNFDEQNEDYNGYKVPLMLRLGDINSNLARYDSPGNVQLVHELYNVEDWSEFLTKDYKGRVTNKPIEGKAVAPYALEAFVEADDEIKGKLNLLAEEIKERLNKIEAEIDGSALEDETGFQNSRLGRIESLIGINEPCSNCGCDASNCDCNNTDNKCSILCRLNDAEDDLNSHMESLEVHNEQIFANTEAIAVETKRATTAEEELTNKIGSVPPENVTWHSAIWPNIVSIENTIGKRGSSSEDTIWEAIDANKIKIKETKDEIGKSDSKNVDTIWGAINALISQIGINSGSSLNTNNIWAAINTLSSQIGNGDSTNSNNIWGAVNENKNSIADLSVQVGSKDSTDTETIWGAINTKQSSASNIPASNEIQILVKGDFKTSISGDNVCTINVSNLIKGEDGPSTKWKYINVNSIKIERYDGSKEVIYPHIVYSGLGWDKDLSNEIIDNRKIEITYNEGTPNTEIEILISAFNTSSNRIVQA